MPPGFRFAFSLLIILATSMVQADDPAPTMRRFVFSEAHMGTKFKILLYGPNQATANQTAAAAYARIAQLNKILSDYDEDSEVRRLCTTSGRGNSVSVSQPLFKVLVSAQRLSANSDGAFDATAGPLIVLWRKARRTKQKPADNAIEAAMNAVGYSHMQLKSPDRVILNQTKMRIDLGGIAKGYAADEALRILSQAGIKSALV
ncbi:FAD:protein FMN transferase, partial [bacterium]|nr:FAD:protein FMN transferase [bacterium]